MSSNTIERRYNTILMAITIRYKLKWCEYMVKWDINPDLVNIKQLIYGFSYRVTKFLLVRVINWSMFVFIVLLCLWYSTWMGTRIRDLLLFHRWFYNLLVRTLDSNSKWLTWDLHKTRNNVFVANISWLWIQRLQFFDRSKGNCF